MGGPIVVRCLELEDDLAGTGAGQPLIANGGASDVAAQMFECPPLLCGAAHIGMQAIALRADTALRLLVRGGALKGID